MNEFLSEPDETRAPSVLKHRIILLAVVLVGVSLGQLGRMYFPAKVDVAQQDLKEDRAAARFRLQILSESDRSTRCR